MIKTFLDKKTNKNFERIRSNKLFLLTHFFIRVIKNNPFWFLFSSFLAFLAALINYNGAMIIKDNIFLPKSNEQVFSDQLIASLDRFDGDVAIDKQVVIDTIDATSAERADGIRSKIDEMKSVIQAHSSSEGATEISKVTLLSIIKQSFNKDNSIVNQAFSFFFNFSFYYPKISVSWSKFVVLYIIFLIFAKSFVSILHWYVNSFIGDKLEKDLKLELFSILTNATYEKSSSISDKMITQFSSDLDGISRNIWNIPNRLVYVLTSIALSFFYDFKSKDKEGTEFFYILIICALFTSLFAIVIFLLKKSIVLGIEAKRRYEGDNRAIFERMRKLKYIKINSSENFEQTKIAELLGKTFQSNKNSLLWTALFKAVPNYLITPSIPWLFMAIVILLGKSREMSASSIVGYYLVIQKLNSEIGKVLDSILALEELSSDLSIVTDSVVALSDFDDEEGLNGSDEISNGEIIFENVSFFYPSRPENTIISNLSFTFEDGKKYGIAGKNGIGKSTITSILLKLRKISAGQILISGKDINKIEAKNLHHNTCHLTNHPTFFRTSIAENVFYPFVYNEKEDLPRLIEAAKKTKIFAFIKSLPLQFDTVLRDDGSDLSEGQKQQLEAMKVFLRSYKIYIFDEILSNVHPITRKEILKNIFEQLKNKTVITIDHQYDVFEHMDHVYTFLSDKFVEKKQLED